MIITTLRNGRKIIERKDDKTRAKALTAVVVAALVIMRDYVVDSSQYWMDLC